MTLRLLPALLFVSMAAPVDARTPDDQAGEPMEVVRYDYAEVLRVQPVEQVVTVGVVQQQCAEAGRCRQVKVPREVRTTIGYDVDYTYRGSKYRSRLAHDPGRRLRIRIGITPMASARARRP